MYRILFFTLFFLSFSTTGKAFSAFTSGKIVMKDGKQLTGFVKFAGPQAILASKIKFKKSKKSDEQKYKSDDVKYVIVTSTDTPMIFEYGHYFKKVGKKKSKNKEWKRIVMGCDDVQIYISNQFSFTKKGELFYLYDKRLAANKIMFKRPGEEIPTVMGGTDQNNSVGRINRKAQTETLIQYFSDQPELVSAVKKNGWNASNFAEIGNEFCSNAE